MPWGHAVTRVRKPPFGITGVFFDGISSTFPSPGVLPIRIRKQILAPAADDIYKTDVFNVLWGFIFSFFGGYCARRLFPVRVRPNNQFFRKKDWGIQTVPGASGSAATSWPGSFCVYCPVLEPLQTAYEVLRDGRHASRSWLIFWLPPRRCLERDHQKDFPQSAVFIQRFRLIGAKKSAKKPRVLEWQRCFKNIFLIAMYCIEAFVVLISKMRINERVGRA